MDTSFVRRLQTVGFRQPLSRPHVCLQAEVGEVGHVVARKSTQHEAACASGGCKHTASVAGGGSGAKKSMAHLSAPARQISCLPVPCKNSCCQASTRNFPAECGSPSGAATLRGRRAPSRGDATSACAPDEDQVLKRTSRERSPTTRRHEPMTSHNSPLHPSVALLHWTALLNYH